MPYVQILLNPYGSIMIEGHEFTGEACLDATRNLEKALGLAGDRTLKPETYVQEVSQTLENG